MVCSKVLGLFSVALPLTSSHMQFQLKLNKTVRQSWLQHLGSSPILEGFCLLVLVFFFSPMEDELPPDCKILGKNKTLASVLC